MFLVDPESAEASIRIVAQATLTKSVDLSAPGDTDVTNDEANPAGGR
jgi:hypothetical protein